MSLRPPPNDPTWCLQHITLWPATTDETDIYCTLPVEHEGRHQSQGMGSWDDYDPSTHTWDKLT